VPLRVARGSELLDLEIRAIPRCAWSVQIVSSQAIAASADGRTIAISSRLANHATRDDDLAFVIAHEMAHNLQRQQPDFNERRQVDREREADRVGLILSARAGYDTSGAGDFVRRLARTSWSARWGWGSHDAPAARAVALDRLHWEIAALGADAINITVGAAAH